MPESLATTMQRTPLTKPMPATMPPPGTDAVRILGVAQVARQRAQRQIGPARVQQQGHALARQQLAALVEHRLGLGRSGRGARFERAQLDDAFEHGFAPLLGQCALRVPGG